MEKTQARMTILGFYMKIFGFYQIIGGLMAYLLSFSHSIVEMSASNQQIKLLISTLFFALSIVSGVMLVLKKPLGLRLVFIHQLVQIPQIALAGTVFRYMSGLGLLLGFDLAPVAGFKYQIQPPHFTLFLNVADEMTYFTVNIPAIFLAIYAVILFKKYTRLLKETEAEQLNIGQ